MKKLILALAAFLLVAGCGEQFQPTAALLTGRNIDLESETTEYIGRLGIAFEQTEFGLETIYLDIFDADDDDADLQTYGVYILQNLQIVDPNIPLIGRPYLGAQATLDLDNDGGLYGLFLGSITELGGVDILTEFQTRHYNEAIKVLQGESEDKYKIIVGPRFRF